MLTTNREQDDVSRIMVLNAKGGCGKTTIATSLASYYASRDEPTVLIDYDRQGSSTRWLSARPQTLGPIHGISPHNIPAGVTRTWQLRVPADTRRVVIDTPAGVTGEGLRDLLGRTDIVLVPVLPSQIDIHALSRFIEEMLLVGRLRAYGIRLGIIANRVRRNTRSFVSLIRFLNHLQFPFLTQLRETQNYVKAAEGGIGIHDLPRSLARTDQEQWEDLITWLERSLAPRPKLVSANSDIRAQPLYNVRF